MDFNKRWVLLAVAALVCMHSMQVRGFILAEDEKESDEHLTNIPIEQLIKRAAKSPDALNFLFDNDKLLVMTEYDIILNLEQLAAMKTHHRQKRTAGLSKDYFNRWTDKTVNYEIIPTTMSQIDLNEINRSMSEWSHYTCVKFKENSNAQARIIIQDASGCYSYLGMSGNAQPVGLAKGCRYKHIILHELAHALGVHHEQTRPDRDQYITVDFKRISEDSAHNFEKLTWDEMMSHNIPYDYKSIMHYSSTSFSVDDDPVITTKDPKYQSKIGMYVDLSFSDVKTVNLMYDCGKTDPKCDLTDEDCPGQGFVGKDCACWCPGSPVKYCFEEDRLTKGDLKRKRTCKKDQLGSIRCAQLAKAGYCSRIESLPAITALCEQTCFC